MVFLSLVGYILVNSFILEIVLYWIDGGWLFFIYELNWYDDLLILYIFRNLLYNCFMWSIKREEVFWIFKKVNGKFI